MKISFSQFPTVTELKKPGYVWMEGLGEEGRGGFTFSFLNYEHYEMIFKKATY